MKQARKALIIAPDDVPGEFDDYAAACRALNLEPNGHCYVVCRVSTAAGPRRLLTVDLGLLQDTEKADTSDQASLPSAGRSKETASGTGAGSGRRMVVPAAPAPAWEEPRPAAPARPCERELRELEAKNAENTQLREELDAELDARRELEKRVAELEQQLEVTKRPHRPIRPHGDMGPGGPGFGP